MAVTILVLIVWLVFTWDVSEGSRSTLEERTDDPALNTAGVSDRSPLHHYSNGLQSSPLEFTGTVKLLSPDTCSTLITFLPKNSHL